MKKYKIIFSIITFIIILFIYNGSNSIAVDVINNEKTTGEDGIITGTVTLKINDEELVQDSSELYSRLSVMPKSISQDDVEQYYYNQLTSDIGKQAYNAMLTDTTGKGNVEVELDGCSYKVSNANDDTAEDCFDSYVLPYLYDGMSAFRMDRFDRYWWSYDMRTYL